MSKLTCLFLLFAHWVLSQGSIDGIVKDSVTLEPVPFAAVGIAGTDLGTLCDERGHFHLSLSPQADTLKITALGYEERAFSIKTSKKFYLKPQPYTLPEVVAGEMKDIILGTVKYSKKICTAFIGENENWKGEQAAIKAVNKTGRTVYLESFGFYIVRNEYSDSLQFRLMLYEVNPYGYPGKTFLKKPVLFKVGQKQGEVRIDLKNYNLNTDADFFISLECLENKMESSKFCFAGSVEVPSYFKTSPFGRWSRVRGGGGDFNIKARYMK